MKVILNLHQTLTLGLLRRVNAQTVNQTALLDVRLPFWVSTPDRLSEVDWGARETTWTGERVAAQELLQTTRGVPQTNVTNVNFG